MSLKDAIIAYTGLLTLALTVVGLFARGRWRLSRFFSAYALSVFGSDFLMHVWRERFWTTDFWVLRQAVHDLLKMGVALEVGWMTFRLFPGAASAVRRAAFGILGITAVATLTLPLPTWVSSAPCSASSDFTATRPWSRTFEHLTQRRSSSWPGGGPLLLGAGTRL